MKLRLTKELWDQITFLIVILIAVSAFFGVKTLDSEGKIVYQMTYLNSVLISCDKDNSYSKNVSIPDLVSYCSNKTNTNLSDFGPNYWKNMNEYDNYSYQSDFWFGLALILIIILSLFRIWYIPKDSLKEEPFTKENKNLANKEISNYTMDDIHFNNFRELMIGLYKGFPILTIRKDKIKEFIVSEDALDSLIKANYLVKNITFNGKEKLEYFGLGPNGLNYVSSLESQKIAKRAFGISLTAVGVSLISVLSTAIYYFINTKDLFFAWVVLGIGIIVLYLFYTIIKRNKEYY